MGIVTLRPDGTYYSDWNAPINAATAHEAVSDNNPSETGGAYPYTGMSYLLAATGSGDKTVIFNMGTFSLPQNPDVRAERVRLRAWVATNSEGFSYRIDGRIVIGANEFVGFDVTHSYNTVTEYVSQWQPGTPVANQEWTQSNLDNVYTKFIAYSGASTTPDLFSVFLDVEYKNQPQATQVNPSGGISLTSHRPPIYWTFFDNDGEVQTAYHVRIYTQNQYTTAGFNPETYSAWYDSGIVGSNANNHTPTKSLSNGSYRAYVRVAKNFRNTYWWSDWASNSSFRIDDAPPTPTNITPQNGAVVDTDVPRVGGKLNPSTTPYHGRQKMQWQLAKDASFQTSVRVVDEPATFYRDSGLASYQIPVNSQLSQGIWFVRARALDEFGGISGYSNYNSFTVTHPPTTRSWSPTSESTLSYGENGLGSFSWTFTDSSPTDYQNAYQVIVERNSDMAVVADTGKVTQFSDSIKQYRGSAEIFISSEYKDTLLRWKVRVWDSDDVVGQYSPYSAFRIGDVPQVAIIAPTATATTPSPTVQFEFTPVGGRPLKYFRVFFEKLGQQIWDSGIQTGSAIAASTTQTYVPTAALYTNGDSGTVRVLGVDTGNLSGNDVVDFVVDFEGPPAPNFTVSSTTYDTLGYHSVTWTRNPDGGFVSWRIYRRSVGSLTWVKIFETPVPGSGQGLYKDWTAASGVAYEYVVVQVGERFGVAVESDYYPSGSITGTSTEYWLVDPEDESLNFHLFHVTDDSFSEEYEHANLMLLGRGRKTDYGTRYGYIGQLTASLYDQPQISARGQRLALEALKAQRRYLILRNPFGDVWAVTAADFQIRRVGGVGTREFVDVTIPYQEVITED